MRINKQIISIFTFWICTSFGFGQSQKSFENLVFRTNKYLVDYAKLSAFNRDRFVSLKKSGLPPKKIEHIQTHLKEADGYLKDSISESNLIIEFQGLIRENIKNIIYHDQFEKNNIKQLINEDFDLSVAVSEDKKLYNFSLGEKTGGSYRSRISIMHFTEVNQDRLLTEKERPYRVFEGDGFYNIHSIKTKEGTKYVLTGDVRGCSRCFETNVMLVRFKDGVFETDFSYAVISRNSEEGVRYNSKSKVITIDYVTDDLTTNCTCNNDTNLNDDESEWIKKRCRCVFEFNGLDFELTEESQNDLKE